MAVVKVKDVIIRAQTKVDKDNTDLQYYVGGEHIDTDGLKVNRRGLIQGSTIGPMFYYGFKKGDFLLVSRNPRLRKAGVAQFDGICSEKTFVLETADPEVLLPEFLPFCLQNERFWKYAKENQHGSTNFFLNWGELAEYQFDLPDLEQQKKLAKVLWAIIDAKEVDEKLLQQTDELIKSQFIEMFGGIKDTVKLEDCCTLHARVGWQALKKEEFQTTGDYMLITGTDFENGQINYSTCVYVSKERYDMDPNIQVKNGDILITKDGTIGKVAIVHDLPMPATLNAGVFVLRPDGRFNVGFFSYIFQGPIFADFVDVVKTGTTIKHLNQGKLKQFEIPLASEESQKEFSELYRQGDKSKVALQKAIGDLDAMYKRILKDNLG
jgi:type I restriction enzyme S subunit